MKALHVLSFGAGLGVAAGVGFLLNGPPVATAAGTPGDHLEQCEYTRGLVLPVQDTVLFPGQYVATMACPGDLKIVAGGCMTRFWHSVDGAGLTGSGPYELGAFDDRPDNYEDHEDVDGENGWACHFDQQPMYGQNGAEQPTVVGVLAVCCE